MTYRKIKAGMSATLSSRLSDVLNVLLLKNKMSQPLNVFKVISVHSDCPGSLFFGKRGGYFRIQI
jgi:hypothetical protein